MASIELMMGRMKLNDISHKQEQGASRGVLRKLATFVLGYIQVILGHLLGGDGYQTGVLSSNTYSAFNKGVCVSSYLTRDQSVLSFSLLHIVLKIH